MVNEKNRNAYIGKNVETLFKNSVVDHEEVIEKLKITFGIESRFLNAITSGEQGEKADVILGFACGKNINANVKSYKESSGFNQLTRASVSRFCDVFKLSEIEKIELEKLVKDKSINTNLPLFPDKERDKWEDIMLRITPDILKWGFSYKASREILVLFSRCNEIMRIYPMKDVIRTLSSEVKFTKGGFNIGDCISFQRKGGNGSLSKKISKHDIKHPGNDIQLKLKIKPFISEMENIKICEYFF